MAVKKTQMYRRNLDGTETNLNPLTESQYVLMENGQTVQEVLSDRDSDKYTPVITNSSSTFKVGQGDNVDLSSSMKEGAYDSCVLKGKTMVNCIQESSSQNVVLPYEFADGQYVTINDTKESGALGVELKGQTLVNLSSPHDEREIVFNSRYQVYNVTNDVAKGGLKNGEKIFMSMEVNVHEVNIETPNFRVGTCRETGGCDHITKTNAEVCNLPKNTWVRLCAIREVKEVESSEQYSFWFGMRGEHPTTAGEQIARVSFRNPVWINLTSIFGSGKEPTLTECEKLPYFTGMSSCKMPTLHTVGKNLLKYSMDNVYTNSSHSHYAPILNEDGSITLNSCYDAPYWLRKGFYVEKGKEYTVTVKGMKTGDYSALCFGFDNLAYLNGGLGKALIPANTSGNCIDTIDTYGTKKMTCTALETGYITRFYIHGSGLSSRYTILDFQVEEGSTATSYEPHKSSILSLPEEVVLRSLPNGVCDTFNTRTGVYTQRIGEEVLNTLNPNIISMKTAYHQNTSSLCGFDVCFSGGHHESGTMNLVSDKILVTKSYTTTTSPCIATYQDTIFVIRIPKNSDDTNKTLDEFKTWLDTENPKVQYPLAIPVTTKINLSSTLKSWNTTTHIYSEIPENTLYPILSHSNPSYPVILKPSTKYSIVANSYSNNHTNSAINFNLGGATTSTTVGNRVTTITTPSTLSNELLTMSGRGNKLNNVMVIEGDVVGDEPYFEGICDCKSPILSNVGKNLFTTNNMRTGNIAGNGSSIEGNDIGGNWQVTDYIPVKPLIKYYHSTSLYKFEKVSFYDTNKKIIYNTGATNFKEAVISTPHQCAYVRYVIKKDISGDSSLLYDELIANNDIVVAEGDSDVAYESYKSNILSCASGIVKLTEDMFEQGTTAQYTTNIGKTYQWMKENSTSSYDVRRLRTKSLIKIEPNTKLILQNTDNFMYAMGGYGVDKLSLGTFDTGWVQNTTITIPQDVHYISFSIRKKDDTSITISDFKNTKFTLSEVDKTIVLRSLPSGVYDTLNVETGEYVQRIGEVVLDGSYIAYSNQSDGGYPSATSTAVLLNLKSSEPPQNRITKFVCKDLPHYSASDSIWMGGTPVNTGISGVSGSWDFCIRLPYTVTGGARTDSNDVIRQKFKDYLNENPVTVQYELATPIVSTIDMQGFPYAYTNGHVQLSSGSIEQSLTPKVEYSLSANKTGQINSNTKRVSAHQKQLDDFEAMMLTQMVQSAYDKAILQFDYEMQMMSLGGE